MENSLDQPFPNIPLIENDTPDPDNPPWGSLAGVGVWLASVAALIIIPSILVIIWYFVDQGRGVKIGATPEEIAKWAMTPTLILIQIVATMIAHIVTIGICWAVASGLGKRSFGEAIGWQWKGASPLFQAGIIVGITVLAILVAGNLPRLIPDSKTTPFAEMLKASQSVRYVVAFLAVFTAPAVEEFVYRGLLYSPLKRTLGMAGAIITATLLFGLVHIPQYWGAWGSLTGLMILSLVLTAVRARTRSILPCVAIHTLFNLVGAIGIILGKE
jgi:membrane protease YdiL (CAAX protease family)